MGFIDRGVSGGLNQVSILLGGGTYVTSGATVSRQAVSPSGILPALLQGQFLSERVSVAEIWRPVGIIVVVSVTITITIPALTLRKNGVSAATGGVATFPSLLAASVDEVFIPFTNYTFAAADAAGDKWGTIVSTTSTAGTLTDLRLVYAVKAVPAITDGVSI